MGGNMQSRDAQPNDKDDQERLGKEDVAKEENEETIDEVISVISTIEKSKKCKSGRSSLKKPKSLGSQRTDKPKSTSPGGALNKKTSVKSRVEDRLSGGVTKKTADIDEKLNKDSKPKATSKDSKKAASNKSQATERKSSKRSKSREPSVNAPKCAKADDTDIFARIAAGKTPPVIIVANPNPNVTIAADKNQHHSHVIEPGKYRYSPAFEQIRANANRAQMNSQTVVTKLSSAGQKKTGSKKSIRSPDKSPQSDRRRVTKANSKASQRQQNQIKIKSVSLSNKSKSSKSIKKTSKDNAAPKNYKSKTNASSKTQASSKSVISQGGKSKLIKQPTEKSQMQSFKFEGGGYAKKLDPKPKSKDGYKDNNKDSNKDSKL